MKDFRGLSELETSIEHICNGSFTRVNAVNPLVICYPFLLWRLLGISGVSMWCSYVRGQCCRFSLSRLPFRIAKLHMFPPFHASQSSRSSQRLHGIPVSLQYSIRVIPASLMLWWPIIQQQVWALSVTCQSYQSHTFLEISKSAFFCHYLQATSIIETSENQAGCTIKRATDHPMPIITWTG